MAEPAPPPKPAPRPSSKPARTAPLWPRIAVGTLAGVIVLTAALTGFRRLEQFLIRDPRFAFDDPGNSLLLTGAEHASHRAIEAVFAEDLGRSVYLIPIGERRMELKTVDWIKDATVARIWPNRLVAQISERKPVAFVTLGSGRPALIDEDGVILPPARDRFMLPVLAGVRASDPLPERRDRVGRLLSFMEELGDAGKDISEVDVNNRDNIKIRQPYEGRVVTLLLGDRHFQLRYQNFRNHIGEIKHKLPGASTLDMRLEDRITVVE
jgi:cell division septal protein FtsQ